MTDTPAVRTAAGRRLLDLLHQLAPGGHYSGQIAAIEAEASSVDGDGPRWYRAQDALDHAFGPDVWMRSRCGSVRWTVRLDITDLRPAAPCPGCLEAIEQTAGESVAS